VFICVLYFIFFFQAEDGIRDKLVTGVQTCALPIYCLIAVSQANARVSTESRLSPIAAATHSHVTALNASWTRPQSGPRKITRTRSEERRVGKECRYRWAAYH